MLGKFPLKCLIIILIFNLYFKLFIPSKSIANGAIATLTNLEGSIKIQTGKNDKEGYARNGMLLFNGDRIITSLNSKAGILYRDGSNIRLFQESKLTINSYEENFNNQRNFKYLLTLQKGSIRGRFKKGLKNSKIRTPTAIIGIKGTSFKLLEKNNKSTVSLTEGQLEIINKSSKIIINTGQWINNFSSQTNLLKIVDYLPNILSIKPDFYELDFADGQAKKVDLYIQIQNRISEKTVDRSGLIVFESDYKKINLPRRVLLNDMGFAKISFRINTPNQKDQNFYGLIKIRVYLDEDNFEDVADGFLILKVKNFLKKRTLLIHPDRGLVKK